MKNYDKEGRKGDVGLTSCNGGYIEKTNSRIVLLGKLDSLYAKLLSAQACALSRTNKIYSGKKKQQIKQPGFLIFLCRVLDAIMVDISCKHNTDKHNTDEQVKKISEHVKDIEITIGLITRVLKIAGLLPTDWVAPKNPYACLINEARTICREAEIAAWDASIGHDIPVALNRMSDLLFYLMSGAEYSNVVQFPFIEE